MDGGAEKERKKNDDVREEMGFFQPKQENGTGNLWSVQGRIQSSSAITKIFFQFFYFLSLSFLFIIIMLIIALTYTLQKKDDRNEINLVNVRLL